MQENKATILCTRPLESSLVKEADQKGITIDTIEFIRTEAINNNALKERINGLTEQPLTVVFTSMNAVEAVGDHLSGKPSKWKVFCIGATTQQLVKEKFDSDAVIGTANSATALADAIINNGDTKNVTFFCGNQRRDELPDKLRQAQIGVEEIVVYDTFQVTEKITKKYNGILFFSPSAVESFFSTNQLNDQTILFAIGNTTANAIQKYSNNKIVISEEPGKDKLINLAIQYFA